MSEAPRPKAGDVVTGDAKLAFVSEADYHWLRYPRSGVSHLATTCFGVAVGFAVNLIARRAAAVVDGVAPPHAETWEWVAMAIAAIAGTGFWLVGLHTSRHTRRVVNRLAAVFEVEDDT